EVLVVPGPINHPNFAGSHKLIREGAELITSVDDVFGALGITAKDRSADISEATPEEGLVLAALRKSSEPLHIDKIIERTKLETHKANQTVSLLVIKQIIIEDRGGYALI
ncbi:MAG: hypothetical protein AAB686_00015, partial [Patescibacteria group bacterium]